MNDISGLKLCEEFMRVMGEVKLQLHTFASEHGMTAQQLGLMYNLYSHGHLVMGVLAEKMHCDASNITGITERLVAQGYIVRTELPEDRRTKQLSLTERGQELIDTIIKDLPEQLGFNSLSAEVRKTLYTHLHNLPRDAAK